MVYVSRPGVGVMGQETSKLARLANLSAEMSSEDRRALLREVTDVFLRDPDGGEQDALVDKVVSAAISDFSMKFRTELAQKIASSSAPFGETARRLAMDDIAVARPVLERSRALSDDDLFAVVMQQSQDHLLAVTRRETISEKVSGALVERGEDRVVASLLGNEGAKIGQAAFETVSDRAQTSELLRAPLIYRKDAPVELLNEIYLKVEGNLRQEILRRFNNVSPEELDLALARNRRKVVNAARGIPPDMPRARVQVEELRKRDELKPPVLMRLLRQGKVERTTFLLALAKLTDVDYALADQTIADADLEALALLCRAAGFERALFVSLAMSIVGSDQRMGKVEEFGKLYESIPPVAAQRAMRFWKVRTAQAA